MSTSDVCSQIILFASVLKRKDTIKKLPVLRVSKQKGKFLPHKVHHGTLIS